MAVGESKGATVVMAGGRETDPGVLTGAEEPPLVGGIDAKGALLDTLFVFVNEHEGFAWSRTANV